MIVPSGKEIYIRSTRYRAGQEIPVEYEKEVPEKFVKEFKDYTAKIEVVNKPTPAKTDKQEK